MNAGIVNFATLELIRNSKFEFTSAESYVNYSGGSYTHPKYSGMVPIVCLTEIGSGSGKHNCYVKNHI